MQLENLKTPSLILDADRMTRNAERMTARAKALNVNLRPHVKTHKCVEIARIQTTGNAGGIMVSTLAEARYFLKNNFRDITYGAECRFQALSAVLRAIRYNLCRPSARA